MFVNPIKKIKFGIRENLLLYTLLHKYKIPEQMKHPNKTSINLIIDIFKYMPRDDWYDCIKPLIWDLCKETNGMEILYSDNDNYPFSYTIDDSNYLGFNIEDLKKKVFNIEPLKFYTHKKYGGVSIVSSYIPLDIRLDNISSNNHALAMNRAYYGSVVESIGIANDGYTFGWEKGHHFLIESDCFYQDFKQIKYKPKEGEFLYYIDKYLKKELTLNYPNDYDKNIFGATVNNRFILGDKTKRKYLESFFKDFN